jgi:cobalt/nickel transport system permease protein
MQPIHLAIGLVEGLITAAVLCFVQSARPELLAGYGETGADGARPGAPSLSTGKIVAIFGVITVLVAGGLSVYASAYPDGLEWSMEKTAGTADLEREGPVYGAASEIVEKTAFMPDYGFKNDGEGSPAGTRTAGIVGSLITVALAAALGLLISALRKRPRRAEPQAA